MSKDYLRHSGEYYGYPSCCVENFIEKFPLKFEYRPPEQQKAAKYGFIPCSYHSHQILEGKIKIEDIILPTRQHSKPFKK